MKPRTARPELVHLTLCLPACPDGHIPPMCRFRASTSRIMACNTPESNFLTFTTGGTYQDDHAAFAMANATRMRARHVTDNALRRK